MLLGSRLGTRVISPYFSSPGVEGAGGGKVTQTNPAGAKTVELAEMSEDTDAAKPSRKKARRSVKVEYSSEAPAGWEEVYANIQEMRAGRTAPVDTMGCERAHDPAAPPAVQRFQCLVSLMLSSQTRDEVNYAAMLRLREHGLTVDSLLATSEEELGELIKPVGFWRSKAKYLLEVARVLKEDWGSDIPDTLEGLVGLRGVGPKMAHICMAVAWGRPVGIGVDTHVHRICGRLGWSAGCREPEETRRALEAWLPRDRWAEINWLLVGFGQETCLPVGPRCGDCLNRQLCPAGRAWTPSPRKGASPRKGLPSPKKETGGSKLGGSSNSSS